MRSFAALLLASVSCTSSPSPSHPPGDTPTVSMLARFDAAAGELPEGFVVAGDRAYVGFAPSSRVVSLDVDSGAVSAYAQLPAPVPGKGFMTGLAVSPTGELYAGLASFVPEVQAGIYRVPAGGGAASLFASDPALGFPNALAFETDGSLWATDSGSGSVFHIDAAGKVVRWASGAALTGDKDGCGGAGPGFAIGANGLVVEADAVHVVNMDHATLVKIPRLADGRAGQPVVVAGPDCDALGGADGLARAPDGSFTVAVNRQDKLVRVSADGAIQTLSSGAPLDFPATLAYRGATLLVSNFALARASAGQPAAPGIVEITP